MAIIEFLNKNPESFNEMLSRKINEQIEDYDNEFKFCEVSPEEHNLQGAQNQILIVKLFWKNDKEPEIKIKVVGFVDNINRIRFIKGSREGMVEIIEMPTIKKVVEEIKKRENCEIMLFSVYYRRYDGDRVYYVSSIFQDYQNRKKK